MSPPEPGAKYLGRRRNERQLWEHSPVWVRTWPCSSQGLEKAFPQVAQTQGSVWLRMCILRAPRLRYSLLQYLQLKAFRD